MSWAHDKARKKLQRVKKGETLQRSDPLCTSFHEGAHAVFAEGFGTPVEWVTCSPLVEEGRKLLGYVKTNGVTSGPQATVKILAGDIAEFPLIFGQKYTFDGYMSGSDAEDLAEIWKASQLDLLPKNEMIHELQAAADQTSALVDDTKHWIEAVAIEMYAQKRIQGDQVRDILRREGFYTPQNPLLQFHLRCWMMRVLAVAQMGGLKVPKPENGLIRAETLMEFLQENGTALGSLLLKKDAKWNQLQWGDKNGMTSEDIMELMTCSKILKTFGVANQFAAVAA